MMTYKNFSFINRIIIPLQKKNDKGHIPRFYSNLGARAECARAYQTPFYTLSNLEELIPS